MKRPDGDRVVAGPPEINVYTPTDALPSLLLLNTRVPETDQSLSPSIPDGFVAVIVPEPTFPEGSE